MLTQAKAVDAAQAAEDAVSRSSRRQGLGTRRRRRKLIRPILAWLLALITAFPFVWLILGALRPATETFDVGWPKALTLDNLRFVLTEIPFPLYLLNSAIVAITVTVGALLFHSMAAYALARLKFPGRELTFTLMISTMLVSLPVIMVPLFLIIKQLGLLDSYGGLILPSIFNAFGIFLLRQYYLNVPKELEDAAEIDGCSYLGIYWHVILPLGRPILSALAVLYFLVNWNSFLWPLTITRTESLFVIQLGISSLQGQFSASWNYILAGSFLAAIPTIIVFIIGQRWLVDSLKTSGIK